MKSAISSSESGSKNNHGLFRRRLVMALPLLSVLPLLPMSGHAARNHLSLMPIKAQRMLMGTQVDITVVPEKGQRIDALEKTIAIAFLEMQRLERLMSRYHPNSELSRLKRMAGKQPLVVSQEVMAVLRSAQQLNRLSDGAFDPTVGALVGWGFEPGHHTVPSDQEIARMLALVNMQALQLDATAGTAYLAQQGMALDLGGIAKLPILKAGMDVLEREGVAHALINGGGDVLTLGKPAGMPWRVGVRSPQQPSQMLGVVSLHGRQVLASSGDYERGFVAHGRYLHHILDPRNGWPTQEVHGISLLAERVEDVNGWGTALMVQGAAQAKAWAQQQPQTGVLVAARGQTTWLSPRLQAAMHVV